MTTSNTNTEGGKMRTEAQIKSEIETVKAQARKLNALQNEGGYGYDHTDKDRLANLAAELRDAEWGYDATVAKRAAWNDSVRDAMRGGKLAADDMARIVKRLGYSIHQVKRAMEVNGIV